MKKAFTVMLALFVLFAFCACSSKEYNDTVVTAVVTDENGETVTDESGNVVTETVTASESKSSAASSSSSSDSSSNENTEKSEKTTKKSSNSKKTTSSSEKTTKSSKSSGGSEKTTKKNTTSTSKKAEETTTEKAKKREVTVKVKLPYYNDKESKLSIRYKTEDDDEYKILKIADPDDSKKELEYETVKLDGKTTKKYSLGNLKGKVTVKVYLSGVDESNNSGVIAASESSLTISPVTGIEMLNGEDD